jgi:antitoxin PrlF
MKVTTKGQVTVPIEIRQKLGILPNTEVEFVVSGKNVLLRKMDRSNPRGRQLLSIMQGRAGSKMSTDQIMALTRGE